MVGYNPGPFAWLVLVIRADVKTVKRKPVWAEKKEQDSLKRRISPRSKQTTHSIAQRLQSAQHSTSCASRPALCYRFSHSIILHPPQCLYSKPIYLGGWLMALHDHKWILSFLPIGHLCHHRQPGLKWDEGAPLLFYHQRWSEPSRSICFPTGLTL